MSTNDQPVNLPTTLPGNQLLLEGLVADVLNEHFGEAVELIGIVLYRRGSLSFPDIVRICNLSFLAFPRDMLNPFNAYNAASAASNSMSHQHIRDALIVLIHYGLVDVVVGSPTTYTINPMEVVYRLCLPSYLALFSENAEERSVMEKVLQGGMVKRSFLARDTSKDTVASLMARRFLRSVDSYTSTEAGELVVTFNTAELQLCILKRYILDYVSSKHDAASAAVLTELLEAVISVGGSSSNAKTFRARISVGDLTIADLTKRVKMGSNQLIATLIKLQQLGLITKRTAANVTAIVPAPAAGRKRKAPQRALNTKQLMSLAEEAEEDGGGEYFSNLLESAPGTSGGPSYQVRFYDIIEEIQAEILFEVIKAKYGQDGARVFELLFTSRQKLEASHIADICAISREDALKYVHVFSQDGICQVQEVPKIVQSCSAGAIGGAMSALMRSVASSFWLYFIDPWRVRRSVVSLLSNSAVNLRRRFRFEVNLQCKLEDRASVLTQVEEEYFERVHVAQDTLEANGINLVFSLIFLLVRTN